MALTSEQRTKYEAWLEDAEKALHALIMGKSAVSVNYEGESVTFVRADEGRLRRYIGELRTRLGRIKNARRKGISV